LALSSRLTDPSLCPIPTVEAPTQAEAADNDPGDLVSKDKRQVDWHERLQMTRRELPVGRIDRRERHLDEQLSCRAIRLVDVCKAYGIYIAKFMYLDCFHV